MASGRLFRSHPDNSLSYQARINALQAAIAEIKKKPDMPDYQSVLYTQYEALVCQVTGFMQNLQALNKYRPREEREQRIQKLQEYLGTVKAERDELKAMSSVTRQSV